MVVTGHVNFSKLFECTLKMGTVSNLLNVCFTLHSMKNIYQNDDEEMKDKEIISVVIQQTYSGT